MWLLLFRERCVPLTIDNPFPSTIRYASLHTRMTEMAEQRTERRLAAILAGDVAGYSKLMGADEEDTLTRLNAHRNFRAQDRRTSRPHC